MEHVHAPMVARDPDILEAMGRALQLLSLPTALALMCATAAITLAAFAPWIRSKVAQRLSIGGASTASLAAIYCPLEERDQTTDPDRIYFLSCGGIY